MRQQSVHIFPTETLPTRSYTVKNAYQSEVLSFALNCGCFIFKFERDFLFKLQKTDLSGQKMWHIHCMGCTV
jgi:hypothetical protein